MTQRRFGIPVLAVAAALCASAVVVVPAVGATGAAGTTRQVPAAGKTAVNPTPTGNDLGVQQPELGLRSVRHPATPAPTTTTGSTAAGRSSMGAPTSLAHQSPPASASPAAVR